MNDNLKLVTIGSDIYDEYKLDVIFNAYKWDPQVGDHNTVAKHVILMSKDLAINLGIWAEALTNETHLIQEALLQNIKYSKEMGIPTSITKKIRKIDNYNHNEHVSLMRYDFHPTTKGWMISEVNSDVPGGLAEASILPEIASKYITGAIPGINVAKAVYDSFKKKNNNLKRMSFVHATSYSDDRQVMQFLGDYFEKQNIDSIYSAPDHIKFNGRKANNIVLDEEGNIDGIVRFFPLEWLENLPRNSNWAGFFNTITPSCNHPINILSQSKRLPIVWDKLGINIKAWKQFLPNTIDPKIVLNNKEKYNNYIFKPALGRVGEGISIPEVVSIDENKKIASSVKKYPRSWVAQEKFTSVPIKSDEGEEFHLCIGVFTVDDKCAGFYGRISPYPRIDLNAKDIPILIYEESNNGK